MAGEGFVSQSPNMGGLEQLSWAIDGLLWVWHGSNESGGGRWLLVIASVTARFAVVRDFSNVMSAWLIHTWDPNTAINSPIHKKCSPFGLSASILKMKDCLVQSEL